MMTAMCLVFLLRDAPGGHEVLLGLKQQGFGTGRIVGIGGHVEPGESDAEAAVREAFEETGFHIARTDLYDAGRVVFHFPGDPGPDLSVVLFRTVTWTGELTASDELDPQWHPVDALPIGRMWDDSRIWLPHVLRGERIDAEITYDRSGSVVTRVSLAVLPHEAPGDPEAPAERDQ